MQRVIGLGLLLIVAWGGVAFGQCDCAPTAVVEGPECYAGFWVTNPIEFKLVVPGDYFFVCPTCPVPAVAGWRVEAMDGTVVFQETYDPSKGHYHEMMWLQTDTWGNQVPAGDYRLVIVTDVAGEISHMVRIQARPCVAWPCWCGCWGCCPTLDVVPCCIPYGTLYVSILNQPSVPGTYVRVSLSIVQSGSSMP